MTACRYCGTVPNPSTPEVCSDEIDARNCGWMTGMFGSVSLKEHVALADEATQCVAERNRLRSIVDELANDLESELKARYHGTLNYPSERRRFERDMDVVVRARALLKS